MIKYCVWDIGKTVYDYSLEPLNQWLAIHTRNLENYTTEGGLKVFDFNPYMCGRIDFLQFCQQLCQRFDVEFSENVPDAIREELHRGIGRHFEETERMMKCLQKRGIENVVFSNALSVLAGYAKLEGLVRPKYVYTSYQTGLLKPDPAVYEFVRSQLGCRFEEMLTVDDKLQNIEAARRLGMAGILFQPHTVVEKIMEVIGYSTRAEVEAALRKAPKGLSRAKILQNEHNRRLIAGSGANVTLYCGEVQNKKGVEKRLQNIFVGVLVRRQPATGKPDGWGTFGGLAEMVTEAEFAAADIVERRRYAETCDNVELVDGEAILIRDPQIIVANNVRRETREELGNLGIHDFNLNHAVFEDVIIPGVKDDNFVINRWNGEGTVWAITPHCHLLKVECKVLDNLQKMSMKRVHEENSEASAYRKVKLLEALSHFGRQGEAEASEDGRDMTSDYRYPHEWIVVWALAAKLVNHDDQAMLELAAAVQAGCCHPIRFDRAARQMKIEIKDIAQALGIESGTVIKMQQIMDAVLRESGCQSL